MAERNLDFDKVINRKNTRCLKYDFAVKRGKPADVLPLWVADMDFETSSYIEDALVERAKEGIFGYSEVQTPYFEILANWMKTPPQLGDPGGLADQNARRCFCPGDGGKSIHAAGRQCADPASRLLSFFRSYSGQWQKSGEQQPLSGRRQPLSHRFSGF